MESTAQKAGPFSFIFKILKQQKRSRAIQLTIMGCFAVQLAYKLFYPVAMRLLVDTALPQKNGLQVFWILTIFAVGYLALVTTSTIRTRALFTFSTVFSADLRLRILRALQRVKSKDENFENRVLTHLTDDLRNLESSLTKMWLFIRAVITLIFSWIMLLTFDWRFSIIALFILPLNFIFPRIYARKLPQDIEDFRTSQSRVLAAAKEIRAMQSVIRILRLGKEKLHNFKRVAKASKATSKKFLIRQEMVGLTGAFTIEFMSLLTLGIGAVFVVNDVITIGTLVGLLQLFSLFDQSISGIVDNQASLAKGSEALDTIEKLIAQAPKYTSKSISALPALERSVTFEDASVQIGNKNILSNLSLQIKKGESVAFVGPSGAGKSSALNLILMDVSATQGRILFDDIPLDQVYESAYLPKLGVVFQEPKLFEGTIRENILLANPSASEEEMYEAARQADILEEILSFSDGFDTYLKSGANQISGGQKQRITIARALINQPELLLLDEASSALDPFTDAAIEETIAQLHGKTTIVSVTHRLKSIKDFDTIFVLKEGRLEESGSHLELLEKRGLYMQLWERQNGVELDTTKNTSAIKPEWLRFVPIFANLDEATLESLAGEFVMERHDAEKVIFSEGDFGDKMYVIASGMVEISVGATSENEHPETLAKFSTGDFFGEIALLLHKPRTAQAKCKSICILLTLTSKKLKNVTDKLPNDVLQKMHQIANERLRTNPTFRPV